MRKVAAVLLGALVLAGCSSRQSVAARSFTDGQNYALQHKSGTLASVCFSIYQHPNPPVPKGDNLKQWLSGCGSVFPRQFPYP
jgi:uncharacterized protein YceK